ncbi:TIGR03936 family radical SAM-associated protein [Desulfomonile tiedjei]|uniref:Radical SAM-linked protein n=1 Tax=Desulfomonile tiedjei (strain ATCC 49306 / DSM 6799 / DCB-1) TaxID=706587 RepID=I4C3W5_DESTA|nr:TIGR03936 family radical SAM-associated protein [Desulfomonile tiedjei]AFM24256.1 radical SAM-linked protein [Desulfomonile tiedjei DSM 6799]
MKDREVNSVETDSNSHDLEKILVHVQKPARYIGEEINAIRKDVSKVNLRIGLCFPDVYEVGMSHLGLKILYSIVNARTDLYAERVFAPWPDMEDQMRRNGLKLVTLETGTPVADLDLVGFSLQYELCATTVLQILDLAGIPLRANDRTSDHPFVIGGGPVAFNPVPLSPFFDAFVIGDGEEAILEVSAAHCVWKQRNAPREELLRMWKEIPGVFVPSLHTPRDIIQRRVTTDLEKSDFPSAFIVPFCETVHDRIGVEVARGCTRGCRFCQAGMIYRPVREKSVQRVLHLAEQNLRSTGWEEVALLSLSTGDHSCISDLIGCMVQKFGSEKIAVSLPSLRTDTFNTDMGEQIRRVRKTGFTLAPEAGTERLRKIINKGNTEEDLQRAITAAFDLGWQSVKLYFMIGLPHETDEDLDGIVTLVRKAFKWAKGGKVTASISTFVPKAHTPFQWAEQISIEETVRRQQHIRKSFGRGRIQVKFHDPRVSFLEGVFARADEKVSDAIEIAFRKGARFDGWDDQLKFDIWMDAFSESGIDPERYLAARVKADPLPWGFIHGGVTEEYLSKECDKALREESTVDCRKGWCQACGVCDFSKLAPTLAPDARVAPGNTEPQSALSAEASDRTVRRFRLQYGKVGRMRFLGHQDLIRLFERSFRRSRMTLDFSNGFHPHPRLRFSAPLALGVESVAEFLDFDLVNVELKPDEIMVILTKNLPNGITPLKLQEILLNEPLLSARIRQFSYKIKLLDTLEPEQAQERIDQFWSAPEFPLVRKHKGKFKTKDLKEWIKRLDLSDGALTVTIRADASGSVHPLDAVAAVLGIDKELARDLHVIKTDAGTHECD